MLELSDTRQLRRPPARYLAWCTQDNMQGTQEFPARLLTLSPHYSCFYIFQDSFHESAACTQLHSRFFYLCIYHNFIFHSMFYVQK